MFAFIGLHLWLVMRHGISEPPVAGKPVDPKTYRAEYEELLTKSGKPFWPDLAWRDVVVTTGLVIAIALAAFFVGPPALDRPPDPSVLAADPRPDWYLLWYFGLLSLIPERIEGYVMIGFPILDRVMPPVCSDLEPQRRAPCIAAPVGDCFRVPRRDHDWCALVGR
jgi:ubiquinol-cytochrome c reductase cytochrome b subunit